MKNNENYMFRKRDNCKAKWHTFFARNNTFQCCFNQCPESVFTWLRLARANGRNKTIQRERSTPVSPLACLFCGTRLCKRQAPRFSTWFYKSSISVARVVSVWPFFSVHVLHPAHRSERRFHSLLLPPSPSPSSSLLFPALLRFNVNGSLRSCLATVLSRENFPQPLSQVQNSPHPT